jgi:hypothetical protein
MVYIVYDKKRRIVKTNNLKEKKVEIEKDIEVNTEDKTNENNIPNINSASFKFNICDYIIDHINTKY